MVDSSVLSSTDDNSQIKDEKFTKCNCRQRKPSLAPSTQEKEDDRCQKVCGDKFVNEKLKHVHINYAKNSNNMSDKMSDSSDVIANVCGPFGRWQLRTILLIFLVKIPSSWFMACIIFTAPVPQNGDIYCKRPENLPMDSTDWIKMSHPVKELNDKDFKVDFCHIYEEVYETYYINAENVTSANPLNITRPSKKLIPCESFEHEPFKNYTSVITQFNLVCRKEILVAVTQFFHLFGVLCGGIIATFMLKYISPRRVMMIGMVSQIVCGNSTGLVTIFELHMLFRTFSAICCGLMYTAGGMIFCDITSGKYRTITVCMFEQFWSIGVILLPGLAYFSNSWSMLYMAISCPTIALMFLHRWIPDSPRWMLQRGRIQEAKEILMESATINGKLSELPSSNDLDKQLEIQAAAMTEAPPEPSFWAMWTGPGVMKNLIACHLSWSIYIIIYYGFLLNVRGFGRQLLEINTVVAGICEIVGTFLGCTLILCTTRKWLWTSILNVVASFVALSAHFIPSSVTGSDRIFLLMVTSMVAKITISSTLSILTTCTTELVSPEKKRMCGYSTIVWARIWLLAAPFVGSTSMFGQLVPQTALSIMNIVGSIITGVITSPRTIPKPPSTKKSFYPDDIQTPDSWMAYKVKDDKMAA